MFIHERIDVEFREKPGPPVSFTWRGETHAIREVTSAWQDFGIGATPPRLANWRLRRHRNYYRVVTDAGDCYELYLDRGGKTPVWILYRQLTSTGSSLPPDAPGGQSSR